ncbi:AraC family transcriptional regulator ligand-binding domain-containing protein [Actinomadura sp. GTD37]|uniref:AraC family transcriptional regulator n=1 Tax=Actinomadura sp. GTD37 TaxID=1778030 RepID=UPI0035C1704A
MSTAHLCGAHRTVPIELVHHAIRLGAEIGRDIPAMLEAARVPECLLGRDRSRVTEDQVIRMVRELWRRSGDEMFGLSPVPLARGSFRLLCYSLIYAPDLHAAANRLESLQEALPALPVIRLLADGPYAEVQVEVPDRYDPSGVASPMALAVVHRVASWLIGRPIPLVEVTLPGTRRMSAEINRVVFGVDVCFNVDPPKFRFPRELLKAPIVRTPAEVDEFVATSPAGLIRRPGLSVGTGEQVRRIIADGLRTRRRVGSDEIARRLAFSPQTLRRKLAGEGTCIRRLREDLLRDTAIASLVDEAETVAELAERLGFSEQSSFTRAFRRWTGSSPHAYRRRTPTELRS